MGAGDEDGLDEGRGGGGFALVVHQVLQQQGRGASGERRGHARAAHVGVTGVVGQPTDIRSAAGFG